MLERDALPLDSAELHGLSGAVVRTIREPLLILDAELRVRSANPAFYGAFRTAQR